MQRYNNNLRKQPLLRSFFLFHAESASVPLSVTDARDVSEQACCHRQYDTASFADDKETAEWLERMERIKDALD